MCPTVFPGTGPEVHDPVGGADRIGVVLHHHDGVSHVAEPLQRGDQSRVVSLVQPNGRLIENIEYPHQLRADLRCETDALSLSSGESTGSTIDSEIVESDVHEETLVGNRSSLRICLAMVYCRSVKGVARSSVTLQTVYPRLNLAERTAWTRPRCSAP